MSVETDVYQMLCNKELSNLSDIAKLAMAEPDVLFAITKGVTSKEDVFRYNCFLVLSQIVEDSPGLLYAHWVYFEQLLDSPNAYHRSIAVRMLAGMTPVDNEKRFEAIFDHYYMLLNDEKVMVSRFLVQSSSKIIKAKPSLSQKITLKLLDVDKTCHTQSRIDLICADIIEFLNNVYDDYAEQEKICAFVRRQLGNSSPKARKAASIFLKTHGL